ncbi:2-hydroxychromene-2-carboxylate isomerase [Duganella sp. BJB488]|uniref:2-hydroxychromene-2-carboxylate isomerase n=1 Tax=unclassified Duganella TaxID=2636909 RepID=UPI000E3538D6|nr:MULTISPECIES: 2-hydroxychromene-2-carboxylate isomerase [unclassified Duganella]NVD68961.1 2-hydroxychromene-2-carboxylate isomerase [Duganella sp. BJB1802]RFP16884.1 2-hydroxychromene-2-carboxylate isomerase [Duganella sp. BJB489]RFP20698.1 2-hydroxychromene-2-carboxylate isomerase [Duganella sp. BJB488]RFP32247.1 2-hydroxychromene-2-carboxylate isomerase [Duganella sp. BJB480]
MSKVCQYFFAAHSPWTYLGHERFVAMARQHGVQIEVRPVDLGKVFGVSGGLPLAKRAPQRQAYRLVELTRWSDFLGIPLNVQPKFFPVSPELANRMLIAARLTHGVDVALSLSLAVMRGLWAEDKNIGDEETLAQIAGSLGLDGKALIKSAETASVQAEYDRNTEDATAASVFGSPWYVLDGESFWGQDRLDFLERAMQK